MQETQERWVRSLGGEDPLEKDMAPHSSILAWRIPWTEKPGGLQSMVSRESDTTEVTQQQQQQQHVHVKFQCITLSFCTGVIPKKGHNFNTFFSLNEILP